MSSIEETADETDETRTGNDLAPLDEPSVSLVEIEPGMAVLFADKAPTDLDFVPFAMMTTQARQELTDKLSVAAGFSNVAVQGAQGIVSAQGLVRLAPQTLEALKVAQPMTSGGWNLGSIVGNNGQIAASVRWAPATGMQSVGILAALGPAAALLALQLQLASISRRLDENIELTRDILKALHEDQWATLLGLHETTMRAVEEAQAAGTVNDHIFRAIGTREADLRKQRHLFTTFVRSHTKALDSDAKTRRDYIQKNVQQLFADAHGMLMAEGSWYRYQVLRAGCISRDEANAVENEGLLANLVAETQRDHAQAMDDMAALLGDLERQCRLLAELPGELSLPFTAKRKNFHDAVAMAVALAQIVSELRNRSRTQLDPLDPELVVFNGEVPAEVLRILRWAIPGSAPLLAIADVNLDRLIGDSAYLGVTPDSFFISAQSAIRKQGAIDRQLPLSDIRYVRLRESEKQGPVLDIITADENIRLSFDSWANKGEGLDGARRIANLLAAAMDIPESERRTDALLSSEYMEKIAIAR
ncbi:hypothetical protein [uncultured Salinibacterium sp.]|uniref:hypothetical protein n=1 Tax=uncultured Salinibacterium sp. TaxID=459274 RepID=UPI0030DBE327|tara:strand:+ start:47709 stop:49304 length:1596 start_codon:yes stop_codon:yes gene_type:complete